MTATAARARSGARREPGAVGSGRRGRHLRVVGKPAGHRSSYFLGIFAITVVLSLLGLVMVLSASAATALEATGSSWFSFRRHLMWLSIGAVAMFLTMRTDYRRWCVLATPMLVGAIALLLAVLVPGVGLTRNGSTRWIGYGPLTIQPAEVAKLAVVVFVAALLARPNRPAWDTRLTLRPVVVLLVVMSVLLMRQPNLGTTIVVCAIGLIMLFAAGAPIIRLGGTVAVMAGLGLLAATAADYRRDRLLGFLDPWSRRSDEGLQTVQSLASIANGEITGVGLGASRGKWGYLPFAHTDFIFSIIAEELGLLGGVTVVGLFVAFGVLGFAVALHAPDRFGMLLAIGVTSWLLLQAFINIGVTLGVLPVTGIPLPFLSFGGSSLVVTLAACGILMSIARQARP